jgi:hypothetical protein
MIGIRKNFVQRIVKDGSGLCGKPYARSNCARLSADAIEIVVPKLPPLI